MFRPEKDDALGVAINERMESHVTEHPLGWFDLDHPNGVVEASPHRDPPDRVRHGPGEKVAKDRQRCSGRINVTG